MEIRTVDHLEIYAEDAEKAAAELADLFGFTVAGRGGPETGLADRRSVLLRQNGVRLLFTSALTPGHRADEFVRRHGAGIATVGLAVDDAAATYAEAVRRGATPVAGPTVLGEDADRVTFATVRGFGDVEHRFVSRTRPDGLFAPGEITEVAGLGAAPGLLQSIDHLAVCVPPGTLADTVRWYQEVFSLEHTFEERIVVGEQAMDSKVVQSPSRGVTLTIIEPDITRKPGQIDTFVRDNGGAGVQHIAFGTGDITAAVRDCAARGLRFLTTPAAYYDALPDRLGDVGVPVKTLRELSVLADRDYGGVMLQIFTESRHDRRTLFYELIERRGAQTFGSNNIKALYEAIERGLESDRVS